MSIDLTICYQHQDFIIINKPDGMSVHKDNEEIGLTGKVAQQLGVKQVWLVHRLDKITSGLLILALKKRQQLIFIIYLNSIKSRRLIGH